LENHLKKRQKVGFFGGSFDPIHLGHLNLAIELQEAHNLDQVLFCPASQSPHKKETPPIADKAARRAMVAAAIAPLPQFTFLDIEIQSPGVTYTIDSIRVLMAMESKIEKEYFLLLGEDSLENLHTWKEIDQLVQLAQPLVGRRSGLELLPKTLSKITAAAVRKGMTQTPQIEISSTEIRKRLKAGLYCGHLLPAKVLEYISQNKLYQSDEK